MNNMSSFNLDSSLSSSSSSCFVCSNCNKNIQLANKILHELRCKPSSSSLISHESSSSSSTTTTTTTSSSPSSSLVASLPSTTTTSSSSSSSSSLEKLNCQISSSLEILDSLNQIYPFIPNSNCIRPSEAVRELKKSRFADILDKYDSFEDYILHTIFNKNVYVLKSTFKRKAIDNKVNNLHKFYPNEFPYNVKGNHWVMWYGTKEQTKTESEINNDIFNAITTHLNGNLNFNFVWYINPKMTVPEYFHVQVFWVTF